MNEPTKKLFPFNLSKKEKISVTISLVWIIGIGYLTWWNGLSNLGSDKSFRWDEWFWFGIVPATVPYFFYFIWSKIDLKITKIRYCFISLIFFFFS
jgi:hypothetical protein